jgi:formate dehydrogenase subunit gamma
MRFNSFLRSCLMTVALLASIQLAHAAVPDAHAPPPTAEEKTIQQTEQSTPAPTLESQASGKQHFDRHYLGAYGDNERDVILQRGGNAWRVLRNGRMAMVSGAVLLVVPLLIFGFYLLVGPIRLSQPVSGRPVQRFSGWQRLVHWSTAISFLVLAFSGLIILFGKRLMLPWMGHDVFAAVALVSKYLHNFIGPLFIFCSLLLFITFVRKNFFSRIDWQWLKHGGGMISKKHVPTGYFNAGEKLWFWGGLTLLGLLMSATGLVLDFVVFGQTRYILQIADLLHIVGATCYMAGALGHIYIGTIGMQGAYRAMRSGSVDEEWAREHHSLWLEDVQAGIKTPPGAVR